MADFEAREPESKVQLASETGGAGATPTFDITVQVRRYDPELSAEVHWDEFQLTMYGTDRVLDALHKIKW